MGQHELAQRNKSKEKKNGQEKQTKKRKQDSIQVAYTEDSHVQKKSVEMMKTGQRSNT
jgi:hypothetical protein